MELMADLSLETLDEVYAINPFQVQSQTVWQDRLSKTCFLQ